jgi:TRAP-type uncharacterized transport system substrate-binding protein
MEHRIVSALLACLLVCSSSIVAAENEAVDSEAGIVLSSGVQGGGYWNAGARLQAVAETEMGLTVENLPSTGSLDNLEKLLDQNSPVSLVFAQADAVQHYLNKHPNEFNKLELFENIGVECVFIVTGIDSKVRTDEDLQEAEDLRLGIASATSGIAVTYDYLVSQMPDLADITVKYGNTVPLMDQLNSTGAPVDAVMMVHRPRELSAEVEKALANPDRYRFVELSDKRLAEELWFGRKVYRPMKLAMPGAKKPVKTICVLGLLLGNKQKLTLEQRNQLSDVANYHWMKVYATP